MINQKITEHILQMNRDNQFLTFDCFMVEKMLGQERLQEFRNGGQQDAVRQEALKEYIRRLGGCRIAARQTEQKWFGIHGRTMPDREHIFCMGFAMGLSGREVSDYLRRGIGEPDFQVNDYREVVFMYGYHHGLSYEEALDMIEEFERRLPADTEIIQHNYTNELKGGYNVNCHLGREDFLEWMLGHGGEFKGYSMTVLDYFRAYKQEILWEVKADAGKQMEELLKQTSFYTWEEGRHLSPKKRVKTIPRYFAAAAKRKETAVSEDLRNNILELLQMSQLSVDSNSELLAELYADVNRQYRNYKTNNTKDGKKRMPVDVNLMSDKYLSQLLHIGGHKEKQIRLSMLQSQVQAMPGGSPLPEEAREVLEDYGYQGEFCVGDALLGWLGQQGKLQRRRCSIIQRKDLLPLILCAAQKRYLKQLGQIEDYRDQEAKEAFVSLANLTLSACHMELLQPQQYVFDAVLCLCYQPEELYFLSDVLEALAEV